MPPNLRANLRTRRTARTYPCKRRESSSSSSGTSGTNNNSDYCQTNSSNSDNTCSTGSCSAISNAEIAELEELMDQVEINSKQQTPAQAAPAGVQQRVNAFAILEQQGILESANAAALRKVNKELRDRIPAPNNTAFIKNSLTNLLETCQNKTESQLHSIFKAFWKEFSTKGNDKTEDAAEFLFGNATVDLMRDISKPHVLKFAKLSVAYLRSYENPTIKEIIAEYLKPLTDQQVKQLGLTRCKRTNRTTGAVTMYYRDCVGAAV